MPYKVAAFYQFAALPDFRELREPLRAICAGLKLKGSVLLAHEGINGTLAGSAEAIDELVDELRDGALFGGRLDNLELKFSQASAMPFQRLKIRLKKEIVTLGDADADPTRQVGIYVEPADWNDLIDEPDTLVIDTRNAFEVAMGTFEGAVDPGIDEFRAIQGFCRAPSRSGEASQGSPCSAPAASAARRPALSAGARLCGGLSPQGRHPAISRRRAGSREPLARRVFRVRRPRRARPRAAASADGQDSDE